MSDKKLSVLAVLAVIAAGWAVLQNRISQSANTVDFSSAPLIAGLDIESVSTVEVIANQGTETITLERGNGMFVVADKDDYPADISKVNMLINNCLDIRTNEKITDSAQNHADLKVTRETAQSLIRFVDNDGKEIVGLAISPTVEQGAAFARLLSEDEVYSIQSPPWINTRPVGYIDTELLTVDREQIQRVAVTTEEGVYIMALDENGQQVILENMPEGKQFKGTDYKSVFGALSSLSFDDVSSVTEVEDLSFNNTYICRLKDKTVYKLMAAEKEEKTYVQISADYLDKAPVEKENRVESEEELKAKETKLQAIDTVNNFNKQHSGWVYQIPSYKAQDLTKPLSEIIEDIPEEESPADPNTTV